VFPLSLGEGVAGKGRLLYGSDVLVFFSGA